MMNKLTYFFFVSLIMKLYIIDSPIFEVYFSQLALIPMYKLHSSCTALVPQGRVGSTLFIPFTNYVRNSVVFPKHIVSQLIGHLLGDGSLVFSRTSTTPSFVFTQTIKRFDYIWSVFLRLSHYCPQFPILLKSRGKYHFM